MRYVSFARGDFGNFKNEVPTIALGLNSEVLNILHETEGRFWAIEVEPLENPNLTAFDYKIETVENAFAAISADSSNVTLVDGKLIFTLTN